MVKQTVGALLDRTSEYYPHREALVYSERGLRYTYRELNLLCRQLAKGLMKLGVKKGDKLAIWAPNIPEWVIVQFAAAKIGAILVTVNTNYRAMDLEYLLKQSDASTILLSDGFRGIDYIEIIYQLCPELKRAIPGQLKSKKLPYLKNVIYLGEQFFPGMYNWDQIMGLGERVEDSELLNREAVLDPEEVAAMMYTSGTTGYAKGVMLSHRQIVNNAWEVAAGMKLDSTDRLCLPVPFFHSLGCILGILACVNVGAAMVPLENFDPVMVLATVEKEKCTALHGVPTMFIAELEHPDLGKYDLSALRTGIIAGSPCPVELMKEIILRMGIEEITIAYGQTEASPVICQTRVEDPLEMRVSTVGRPLPGVEVKIVDPESDEPVPPGVQGELCTRSPFVMKGYYKMPEATGAAIDREGWLHTGDLAVIDGQGYVRITGRVKDMIIRGGENVYPREIEEFIFTHPKVMDVQVVGVPSPRYGEEVMAFIRLREGTTAAEEEIREFCQGKIARYKIPRYIKFVTEYPMTASGKIQKYKLTKLAIKELGLDKQ